MAWFARYIDAAVVTGTVGCIGAYIGLSGLYIHKVKETLQMYKDGVEVKMDDGVRSRINEVLRVAKIPKACKKEIDFFVMSGDETFSFGSLQNAVHPGIIGLPWYFTYKTLKDIDKTEVRALDGQIIKWDSKHGMKLIDSLIVSEKAQKFVILREIYMLDNFKLYVLPLAFSVCALAARSLCFTLNQKEGFRKQNLVVRFYGKALVSFFCLLVFYLVRDWMHCKLQEKADEKAIAQGEEFYDGAFEFYGKLLQRNKAFRKLLGKTDGPKYFTDEGDEMFSLMKFLFRARQLPITERFNRINDLKNEHFEPDEK